MDGTKCINENPPEGKSTQTQHFIIQECASFFSVCSEDRGITWERQGQVCDLVETGSNQW